MGILVDILIILLVMLSIYLGYKKGLAKLAIKFCAFIIAIVITFILYKPVGNLIINTTSIDESIENSIYNKVTESIQKDTAGELTGGLIESAKQGILPQAARELSINIVYGGTIIVLFVLVRIGLIFVTVIANIITKLPIIKQFNEVGGAIYGLLRGVLVIYIVLMIVGFVGEVNPKNIANETINNTYLTKFMYENNIINDIIK